MGRAPRSRRAPRLPPRGESGSCSSRLPRMLLQGPACPELAEGSRVFCGTDVRLFSLDHVAPGPSQCSRTARQLRGLSPSPEAPAAGYFAPSCSARWNFSRRILSGSRDILNARAQHIFCVPMIPIGTPSTLPEAPFPPRRAAPAAGECNKKPMQANPPDRVWPLEELIGLLDNRGCK